MRLEEGAASHSKARVVIVDDERLARRGIVSRLAEHSDIEVVAEFADGRTALEALPALNPDLLFLDVRMPALSGLDLARALPSNVQPYLIIVTAFDHYAVEAFAVEADDFLLKPLSDERFGQSLTRFRTRLSHQKPATVKREFLSRFPVRSGGAMQAIPVGQVDRISAYGDYARLHVGGRSFLIRETLQALELALDPSIFVRVHRSCIVQPARIERWYPEANRELTLIMQDGTEIRLSRNYRDRFDAWVQAGIRP